MHEVSGFNSNRKWYETVKAKYPNTQPSLGALRQELTLKNNQGNYAADFKTANAASTTEQLLGITDAFGANQLLVCIGVRNKTKPGSIVLTTYPSLEAIAPAFNNSTAASPSVAAIQAVADLEAVFSGITQARIDSTVIFDGLDTRRFRYVPQTQAGLFASQAQSRYADGLVSIEPQLYFDGARKNQVQVNVPTFTGMAIEPDNANFELVLVVIAYGFRVQGGANLKS
jgi:hypothetical protein